MHVLQGRAAWALADNVTSIRASYKLELVIREVRHALDQFARSGNRSLLADAVARQPEVERAAKEVTDLSSTDFEFGAVAKMNAGLDRFFQKLQELASGNAVGQPQAVHELAEQILADEVLPYSKKYLDFNEQELKDRSHDNEVMAGRLVLALALLGVCGAVAGLIAGFGLARGIQRTIYQLTIPLRDVAGRLNQVVGPVSISNDPAMEDLPQVLKAISAEVNSVIEKFHATNRQILRSDQLAALGQLAAGLAHELHNPLMCVKILIQSALADGAASLDGEDLRVLDQEVVRLENLLQSFLDFARPAQLERRQVDLRPLVAQTVTILTARAARRKVSIGYRPPRQAVSLSGDEAQLRQVTLNLLLNALDATPDGGKIWIEVGLWSSAGEDDWREPAADRRAFVKVADNGRGLPPGDPERIFEPFFSTKETGLGLGLAICRRIVESHGGTIAAAARVGGGTVFTIELPLNAADIAPPIGVAGDDRLALPVERASHA